MDCNPPGSYLHGIFLARTLQWLPFPALEDLLDPGVEPASLASAALARGLFSTAPPGKRPILPFRLLQNIQKSSLCYTVDLRW